jgi:predicted nucleic acid-binding protein
VKSQRYVVDSFALLAYLQNETAADRVDDLLVQAVRGDVELYVSPINLGEVAYLVERRYGSVQCEKALNVILRFPLALKEVTLERVKAAAHVKAVFAISYADAFVVSLGQELNAAIVTGDPELKQVESVVDIAWL